MFWQYVSIFACIYTATIYLFISFERGCGRCYINFLSILYICIYVKQRLSIPCFSFEIWIRQRSIVVVYDIYLYIWKNTQVLSVFCSLWFVLDRNISSLPITFESSKRMTTTMKTIYTQVQICIPWCAATDLTHDWIQQLQRQRQEPACGHEIPVLNKAVAPAMATTATIHNPPSVSSVSSIYIYIYILLEEGRIQHKPRNQTWRVYIYIYIYIYMIEINSIRWSR